MTPAGGFLPRSPTAQMRILRRKSPTAQLGKNLTGRAMWASRLRVRTARRSPTIQSVLSESVPSAASRETARAHRAGAPAWRTR